MILILTLISGVAWSVAYIGAIVVGVRDRTYGFPVVALAFNFAWESIYLFYSLSRTEFWLNLVWVSADAVIVLTYFIFGRSEWPILNSRAIFLAGSLFIFACAFVIHAAFIAEFGLWAAHIYSAFLQNVLMSGLFIAMFLSRRGTRGQSIFIAISKCIGTLTQTLIFGVIHFSPLILILGIICYLFDLIYIGLIECQNCGDGLEFTYGKIISATKESSRGVQHFSTIQADN